jgi:hypothetical protein
MEAMGSSEMSVLARGAWRNILDEGIHLSRVLTWSAIPEVPRETVQKDEVLILRIVRVLFEIRG